MVSDFLTAGSSCALVGTQRKIILKLESVRCMLSEVPKHRATYAYPARSFVWFKVPEKQLRASTSFPQGQYNDNLRLTEVTLCEHY